MLDCSAARAECRSRRCTSNGVTHESCLCCTIDMNPLVYFRSLAARFFHRSQTENDLDEELRSHIQFRADDLERFGLGRAEAERRARIEFGGEARFKEECRDAIAGNFIDILIQDVHFGLRMLRKSSGFTAAAIL